MGTCARRRSNSLATAVAAIGLALVPVAGQSPASLPRMPDGRPDLQGTWTNATITPVERASEFTSLVLGPDDVARLEKGVAERIERLSQPSDPNREAPPKGG